MTFFPLGQIIRYPLPSNEGEGSVGERLEAWSPSLGSVPAPPLPGRDPLRLPRAARANRQAREARCAGSKRHKCWRLLREPLQGGEPAPPRHLLDPREGARPVPPKHPGSLLSHCPGKGRKLKLPQSRAQLPLGGEAPGRGRSKLSRERARARTRAWAREEACPGGKAASLGLRTEPLSPSSFYCPLSTHPSPGIFPDTQPAPLRSFDTGGNASSPRCPHGNAGQTQPRGI